MHALGWLGHSFSSLFLSRPFSPFSILFLHFTLLKLETEPTDKEKQQRRRKKTDKEDGMDVCINHCALYIWSFRPIASVVLIQRIRETSWKNSPKPPNTFAQQPQISSWHLCAFGYLVRQIFFLAPLSLTSICRRSCYLLASNLGTQVN